MSSLLAVFTYEWRRVFTAGRIGWWFVLALFPVGISLLIRMQPQFARGMRPEEVQTVWSIIFYLLIPCVCCSLGVFLNAAPAIAGELEQRSWIYLATRPRGILWLMLGKYLVAVAWAVTSALLSVTLATLVSQMDFAAYRGVAPLPSRDQSSERTRNEPDNGDGTRNADTDDRPRLPETSPRGSISALLGGSFRSVFSSEQSEPILRIWMTMAKLSVLSSCSYAALFLMIGAMFPKRAMVFSVAYIALVEVVLSLIPAVINRITIQYRLRSLMMAWADPFGRDQMQDNMFFKYVFADGGNWEQIIWLVGLTVLFLSTALLVAQRSEFTSAAESDI